MTLSTNPCRSTIIRSASHDSRCGSRNQAKNEHKEHNAMATPTDPRREHPSTYFVQDRENVEELTSMQIQDHLMTASMGGVLPEQPDPTIFGSVLDVGCATGGWLIEAAKAYPTMRELVGTSINSDVVAYPRAQAEAETLRNRMQFPTLNALRNAPIAH